MDQGTPELSSKRAMHHGQQSGVAPYLCTRCCCPQKLTHLERAMTTQASRILVDLLTLLLENTVPRGVGVAYCMLNTTLRADKWTVDQMIIRPGLVCYNEAPLRPILDNSPFVRDLLEQASASEGRAW